MEMTLTASAGFLPASECRSWRPTRTQAVCSPTSKYSYRFRTNMVPSFSISRSPTFPSRQYLPNLVEPVCRIPGTLASRTGGMLCLGLKAEACRDDLSHHLSRKLTLEGHANCTVRREGGVDRTVWTKAGLVHWNYRTSRRSSGIGIGNTRSSTRSEAPPKPQLDWFVSSRYVEPFVYRLFGGVCYWVTPL